MEHHEAEPQSTISKLLDLEEIDVDLFRGYSPERPRWGRVYGGQTVGQSLAAAGRTISAQFEPHSLHSYFLYPGDDTLPIIYSVHRLRENAKRFATRNVIGKQKGRAIFTASISFQKPEKGLEHSKDMPKVPPPEQVLTLNEAYRKWAQEKPLPEKIKARLLRSAELPLPMEFRQVTELDFDENGRIVSKPHQQVWMRTNGRLGDDRLIHACAMAYLSDWGLLRTSLLPHGLFSFDPRLQIASLDHSMWFHAPFRCDEWLLYDMHSPRASGARGLVFGHVYSRDGRLVVSVSQEGLIRHRPESVPRPVSTASTQSTTPSTFDALPRSRL